MYINNRNTKKLVPFPYDNEPFLGIWMSNVLNSTLMATAECNTKNSPKQYQRNTKNTKKMAGPGPGQTRPDRPHSKSQTDENQIERESSLSQQQASKKVPGGFQLFVCVTSTYSVA